MIDTRPFLAWFLDVSEYVALGSVLLAVAVLLYLVIVDLG